MLTSLSMAAFAAGASAVPPPGPTVTVLDSDCAADTFTIQLSIFGTGNIWVVGTSSDQGVVADGDITVENRVVYRLLSIKTTGAKGTAEVTVTVTDDNGATVLTWHVIVGDGTAETIWGTANADLILGLGGSDKVYGLDGDDVICGGAGNDWVDAGRGDDSVNGEDGNDWMTGSWDKDRLLGGPGNDYLDGSWGDDKLDGGDQNDSVNGGPGFDLHILSAGTDRESGIESVT